MKQLQKIKKYLSFNFVVILSLSFFVFYPVMDCFAMNLASGANTGVSPPRILSRACQKLLRSFTPISQDLSQGFSFKFIAPKISEARVRLSKAGPRFRRPFVSQPKRILNSPSVGRVNARPSYEPESLPYTATSEEIQKAFGFYEITSLRDKPLQDSNKEFWDKYLVPSNAGSGESASLASDIFFDKAVQNSSLAILLNEMDFGSSNDTADLIKKLILITDQQMDQTYVRLDEFKPDLTKFLLAKVDKSVPLTLKGTAEIEYSVFLADRGFALVQEAVEDFIENDLEMYKMLSSKGQARALFTSSRNAAVSTKVFLKYRNKLTHRFPALIDENQDVFDELRNLGKDSLARDYLQELIFGAKTKLGERQKALYDLRQTLIPFLERSRQMTFLGGSAVIEYLADPPETFDDPTKDYKTGLNLCIAKLISLFNPIVDEQNGLDIGLTQSILNHQSQLIINAYRKDYPIIDDLFSTSGPGFIKRFSEVCMT